jgi:hypothetical protein
VAAVRGGELGGAEQKRTDFSEQSKQLRVGVSHYFDLTHQSLPTNIMLPACHL